jgi:hypothetical protein
MNDDTTNPPNDPTAGQAVPYSRFKAVNDKFRAALAELDALKAGNAAPNHGDGGDTDGQGNDGGTTPPPAPVAIQPAAPASGNLRNLPVSNPSGGVANTDATPDYQAMYETAHAELTALNLARLQDRTALAVGLPLELAPKLAGTTEQEIRADAERLRRYVGTRPQAPNINGSTPSSNDPGFTLSQIEDSTFYNAHRGDILAAFTRGAIRGARDTFGGHE